MAFANCRALSELPIPSSVTYMGNGIFQGCSGLTSLEVPFIGTAPDDPKSISHLFGSNTIPSSISTIKINEPCTELAYNVFLGKKYDRVYLPKTVKKLSGAIKAKNLYFGAAIRFWPEIEMSFANEIDNFYVPSGSSYNLQTAISLTAGVQIKPYGFSGIKCLTTVNMGSVHTTIPDHFFDGCTGLTSYTVSLGVTDIGNYTFFNCTSLKTVTMNSNRLVSIGEYAFSGCSALTSFTFPSSVTTIGNNAFRSCSSLKNVTLDNNVTSLGSEAFSYCTSLQSVTIGTGVTTLNNTFKYCSSLKTVTAPSVTTLTGSFYYCGALETLNLDSLETYDTDSLYGCNSLIEINVSDDSAYSNNENDGILYSKDMTKIIYFPAGRTGEYVMPDTVTEIGQKAFLNSKLTSITFSSSLETIGNYAFEGSKFTSITFPASVKTIGENAFLNSALTNVIIPQTINFIGAYAFKGCSSLESITIPFIGNARDSGKRFINIFGTIPSSLKNVTISNGITSINSDAFEATNFVKNIIVPDSVTSIEKGAFSGCKGIESITLPFVGGSDADDNPFGWIYGEENPENQMSKVPTSLKIVRLSNAATRVPKSAFDHLRYINEVYIGDGVVSIGKSAFATCYSLTYILLGANLTSIGSGAFLNCYNLVEVGNKSALDITKGSSNFGYVAYRADYVQPDGNMYQLSKHATNFYVLRVLENSKWVSYCISYGGNETSVSLPATKYVGTFMAYYHTEITSVSIPSTIETIGQAAFAYCTSLKTITYSGTVSAWNNITKGSNWNQNVPAKKVICSDGEVSI